jgi:hypothetical protein
LGLYRSSIKKILEALTGYKILGVGSNIFVVADKNNMEDVWFSHDVQLKSVLEKYQINVVLDVGANQGQFVRNLRNFYKGKVLSFERYPTFLMI